MNLNNLLIDYEGNCKHQLRQKNRRSSAPDRIVQRVKDCLFT